jgi:shikimate kinase
MDRAWVLIGMMGAGKTSVGRVLAEQTGREFIDTDSLLQQRLGRSIPQIFQVYGEEAFRDHETSVLRSIPVSPAILSTGGGIVLRPDNWDEMRRIGAVIYLQVPFQILVARLESSKKKRPLLEVDDWQERLQSLLDIREPLYRQADIVVEIDSDDVQLAADRTLAAIQAAAIQSGEL